MYFLRSAVSGARAPDPAPQGLAANDKQRLQALFMGHSGETDSEDEQDGDN
jgi:hypothetical protein